ncbi:MAG: 2-oxo acid dehydrogenase subunit E2 [Bacteroidales bacterium]|nr:2-oxo acid dehydrogenase subunit E2 [Bacteroidales bacterium]
MAKVEIILPAMGEGIIEATITRWLVKEGTEVEEDDPVVEVATDKVDTEIPSPASGVITGFAFAEGEIPKVGDVLAWIENEQISEVSEESSPKVEADYIDVKNLSVAAREEKREVETKGSEVKSRTPEGKYLTPLVRKIASEEGVSLSDLDSIKGSGMDGRITKEDILSFISGKGSADKPVEKEPQGTKEAESTLSASADEGKKQTSQAEVKGPEAVAAAPSAEARYNDAGDEIIEMDRIRKIIAEHMVSSKRTSPHVTTFIDVDVTDIINWRNRVKDNFLKSTGTKLTLTPIFFEATARALRQFPGINIQVDGTTIIRKKSINLGMATALPNGNLIVPIIKNADEKSLIGLARDVNDLAVRARGNKLKPDDISGGTFSITNYGTVGNLMGTPIINQPQCAILGIGAVKKMPAVIETPSGDAIAIRQIMYLSLSYDHRVIDGALAGTFISQLKQNLESFTSNSWLEEFEV